MEDSRMWCLSSASWSNLLLLPMWCIPRNRTRDFKGGTSSPIFSLLTDTAKRNVVSKLGNMLNELEDSISLAIRGRATVSGGKTMVTNMRTVEMLARNVAAMTAATDNPFVFGTGHLEGTELLGRGPDQMVFHRRDKGGNNKQDQDPEKVW